MCERHASEVLNKLIWLFSLQVRSANAKTNKSSTIYNTESYVVSITQKYVRLYVRNLKVKGMRNRTVNTIVNAQFYMVIQG